MTHAPTSPHSSPAPLDPSTPLEFNGEEVVTPEPPTRHFATAPLSLQEAFNLACEKKTRDMVDRGYRAFARRHGWPEENSCRAWMGSVARSGLARKAYLERLTEEGEELEQ